MNKKRLTDKERFTQNLYENQRNNSGKRGMDMPDYSGKEFREWVLSQDKFHELYDNWINSGKDKWLIPSVDRIDDSKGYSFDNIQLMTWQENKLKGEQDLRDAKIIHKVNPQKIVLQYDKLGNFIAEHISTQQAKRDTGINQGNIASVCRGERNTAGGFLWKFK